MKATQEKGPRIATADSQTWWGCDEVAEFGGVFDPALMGSNPICNSYGWRYDGCYNEHVFGPFGSELEAQQWLHQQIDANAECDAE